MGCCFYDKEKALPHSPATLTVLDAVLWLLKLIKLELSVVFFQPHVLWSEKCPHGENEPSWTQISPITTSLFNILICLPISFLHFFKSLITANNLKIFSRLLFAICWKVNNINSPNAEVNLPPSNFIFCSVFVLRIALNRFYNTKK